MSLVALVALASFAHADAPQLAQARVAIDEVRYDDAQRLLIAALEAGGNSPAAVRDIYKLLGASAVALGQSDDAAKYYRSWIALDPKGALDAGASPKLREPFDAAKSYVTANGPLDVVAEYVSDDEVRIRVITDSMSLARTARMTDTSVAIVDRGALITSAPHAPVAILDRYGNTLVELRATGAPPMKPPGPTAELPPPPPERFDEPAAPKRSTAFYALAIPTGILLAAGIGFGAASYMYNVQVQQAIDDSGSSYYTDVVDKQKKVTLFWKAGAIVGGAGLVLAIPTTILYMRSREKQITPYANGNGGGLVLSGRF